MKKIMMYAITTMMVFMAGCCCKSKVEDSKSPKAIVQKFISAMAAGNVEEGVSYVQEEQRPLIAKVYQKAERLEDINDFFSNLELLDEEIFDNEAVVHFKDKKNGYNDKMLLRRNFGDWKIYFKENN